jgi:ferredoxin
MIQITVDRATCNGYGNCVRAAQDIFDVDDDGVVVLRADSVEDDRLDAVRQAAYDCPTGSISFTHG